MAKWRRTGKSGGLRTLVSGDGGQTWADIGAATAKMPRCGARAPESLTVEGGGASKTFLVPAGVRYVRPWFDASGRPIALTSEDGKHRLEEASNAGR